MDRNVVSLVVEVELLDEGFVVGVAGGGRRRLAMNTAALPGKIGLAVADVVAGLVQAPAPALPTIDAQGVHGRPLDAPADAPRLDPAAPAGPPVTASGPPLEPIDAARLDHQIVPTPEKSDEPTDQEEELEEEIEEEIEEDPGKPRALSKADGERYDDVCRALGTGLVVSSQDPDAPGFLSAALLKAGLFPDLSKASAWCSRAFAAGVLGRGNRTKEGYRYYVRRPVQVQTPPTPPAASTPAAEPPASVPEAPAEPEAPAQAAPPAAPYRPAPASHPPAAVPVASPPAARAPGLPF